ncbi:IS1182 family transposase [Pedobacter mendelii]|uniref:Transposase n=1 Tax=Pedobacter mendelii TaxID=1908240 RepID=A0ABQ2BII0_9SPHI|nr:IS1182 family transposase [Pedobacter mendelii]GGI27081.1 transposase [Pedobacter mendelii]
MQGKKIYQEKLFLTFQLSEHIPADNIYRRLNELIDFNFLYKSTASYYGPEGQKSIDPVVFMKLMLAGYLENLVSDRRIINALRLRLDIRYFIGYDLDEELPWHSTLSRTRQLYGEEVFTELFKNILKQCIQKGMVSGKRQAVDSVFIKANASIERMLEKEILDDLSIYNQELASNEELTAAKIDSDEKQGAMLSKGSKFTNNTQYSPVDPDSRLSIKPGKVSNLNYLGQVSVDTASHVITHVQVFHADKRDSQCLPAILVRVADTLRENNLVLEEIIADTNYSSGNSLKALSAMDLTGYIPNTGRFIYEKKGFTYHPQGDYYECRNGKSLTFKGFSENDKRYMIARKNCMDCPFKDTCIGNRKYMVVKSTKDKPYYDQMHLRMQTKKAARMMKKRQSTVEPVIGTLVNYLGIKKVSSRGISQANKCLTMAAAAYNLKKLLKCKTKLDEGLQRMVKIVAYTGNKVHKKISLMISRQINPAVTQFHHDPNRCHLILTLGYQS